MITIEGLLNFYIPYHYVALVILVCALYFYKEKIESLPYFIPFLVIHCFVELFLVYYFARVYKNTILVYNYFNIFIISYYFYVFWSYFKDKKWSKNIIYLFVIWAIFTFYIFLSQDVVASFQKHYAVGLIIVSGLIILLLKQILESKVFIEVKKLPIFYFSIGILLLFLTSLPMFFFPQKLIIDPETNIIPKLVQFSNLLLNLGYLGAILCKRMI